ncbi:hypothetical protein CWI36_1368p0010 [Hamiltosporidium magnivora]|uniref:Uncharacterized protein n=1 Tax=Hamiltosporidium magnivora TaxID=148818 RepID=A0A4Q9L1S9_9MICR|nr:hypothetical protein CWI36_1368p0010 [Hamiltosporidium magnivora]
MKFFLVFNAILGSGLKPQKGKVNLDKATNCYEKHDFSVENTESEENKSYGNTLYLYQAFQIYSENKSMRDNFSQGSPKPSIGFSERATPTGKSYIPEEKKIKMNRFLDISDNVLSILTTKNRGIQCNPELMNEISKETFEKVKFLQDRVKKFVNSTNESQFNDLLIESYQLFKMMILIHLCSDIITLLVSYLPILIDYELRFSKFNGLIIFPKPKFDLIKKKFSSKVIKPMTVYSIKKMFENKFYNTSDEIYWLTDTYVDFIKNIFCFLNIFFVNVEKIYPNEFESIITCFDETKKQYKNFFTTENFQVFLILVHEYIPQLSMNLNNILENIQGIFNKYRITLNEEICGIKKRSDDTNPKVEETDILERGSLKKIQAVKEYILSNLNLIRVEDGVKSYGFTCRNYQGDEVESFTSASTPSALSSESIISDLTKSFDQKNSDNKPPLPPKKRNSIKGN